MQEKHLSEIELHQPQLAGFLPEIWAMHMNDHDYMGLRNWLSGVTVGIVFDRLSPRHVSDLLASELDFLEQIATCLHRSDETRLEILQHRTAEVYHIAGHPAGPKLAEELA